MFLCADQLDQLAADDDDDDGDDDDFDHDGEDDEDDDDLDHHAGTLIKGDEDEDDDAMSTMQCQRMMRTMIDEPQKTKSKKEH